MSSKTRLALLALVALTTALSLAIVGLTAHHVSFVQDQRRGSPGLVDVTYPYWTKDSSETRTSTIAFIPANFTMRDEHALLAAGVLGAFFGVAMLFFNITPMDIKVKSRTETVSNLITTLVLNGFTLAVLAVASGLSWYEYNRRRYLWVGNFINTRGVYSDGGQHWNFESWTHDLAPRALVDRRITDTILRSLSRQAGAARIMVLCALLLSVVAMGLHFWAWRKHNTAVREYGDAAPPYDEVAWKQTDLESRNSLQKSAEGLLSPVSPLSEPERARMGARAEMTGDADLKETMGDSPQRELGGGWFAAEKAAGEKM